jgi:CDP-diacylglycerol--glycerol-3-phosphate 3-phosphatidyltransferase
MVKINKIFTASNFLSFLRLLIAIPLWFLFDSFTLTNIKLVIFIISIFAVITDFLDGYLARKRNEITELGKIIDPLADKILVGIVILKLFLLNKIPEYYFWMIIMRDAIIFLGGIYLAHKIGEVLPSNLIGKITVTVISIVLLLIVAGIRSSNIIFIIFYYSSIILTFVSLITYILRAIDCLKKKNYGTI